LSEVRKVCDRVGVIRDGHLAALEEIDDLLARGGKRVRVRVEEEVTADEFDIDGVSDLHVDDEIRFTFTGKYDDLVALLHWYTVLDLDVEEAPLEDVFMRFYGDGPARNGASETEAASDDGVTVERGGQARDADADADESDGEASEHESTEDESPTGTKTEGQ
jgi:ABC-2 type transport system ATP-binding protein